jgi:flagellar hook-basal body complex protein FliE
MNEINSSALLAQMRAMSAAAQGKTEVPQANSVASDFSSLLKQSIDSVNEIQKESGRLGDAFISGDKSVNLADVMIAKQKSSLAFQATIQVRNKLLSAYKDIMSMPV